jgi:hypothetical protein
MAAHETAVASQVWRDTLTANFPTIDVTVEEALKIAGMWYIFAVVQNFSNAENFSDFGLYLLCRY